MQLPKLQLAGIPQLSVATGIHGSSTRPKDPLALATDLIIVMMVYVYKPK